MCWNTETLIYLMDGGQIKLDSNLSDEQYLARHRAFPIARKQSGSATVLGCRYHGWSYNTEGKLTKAPYFDELPGFDKSLNSLFEIHTKQDNRGFLHVNVSRHEGATATPISMGAELGKLGNIKQDAELLDSIEFSGKFNWKVVLHEMSRQHFWFQLTYSPVAVDQTNLRCDIYASGSKESVKLDDTTKDSIEKEVRQKLLAFEKQYKHLTTPGTQSFGNSYQAKIADAVEQHRHQEALEGFEIKPAALKQQNGDANLSKAEKICQAMACGTSKKLDW
ncbi:dioxygenase subunit alpha yeaW [Fusarium sp. NRRL 52700]|nr:dioxygenase subunit alpha yeaW [Fusarium sp. NRRL 52700]